MAAQIARWDSELDARVCRDAEGGNRRFSGRDMSRPWTGEIAGPYCRSLWRLKWGQAIPLVQGDMSRRYHDSRCCSSTSYSDYRCKFRAEIEWNVGTEFT